MEFKNKNIYYTILHIACEIGNIDLVKYIISLNRIDIDSKIILLFFSVYKIQLVYFYYV